VELGCVGLEEYLYEQKDQEVVVIVAPLNLMQKMPTACGLCRTAYSQDECRTCRADREEEKRVIEERLCRDREEPQV